MPTLVISFAVAVVVMLFASVIFLAWAIFFKIPKQYQRVNLFMLGRQSFLSSVNESDRENLKYVRKGLFALLFSFIFLTVFGIVMKLLSLYLLR